jgi:hypothetical protein
MAILIRAALLAILFLLGACATPRSPSGGDMASALPADGPVSVSWDDPADFSERYRSQGRRLHSERSEWLLQLATHLRGSVATRLPAGQRVTIHITDVTLAGAYEHIPGAGAGDIRVLRDIYPPLIELRLQRFGPAGHVLPQSEHRLRDPAYLSGVGGRYGRDALRHEKRMIDEWAAHEFPVSR